MSSLWNGNLQLSMFGQSHAAAVGMVLHGLPAGLAVDLDALTAFLQRRSPGRQNYHSPRREADQPVVLSGLKAGKTCGAPVAMVIENQDAQPADYEGAADVPRPGHADFPAAVKFGGYQDHAGGGHFSGRLTAPLCLAGGLCLQFLAREGIDIAAHIAAIGGICDAAFDPVAVTRADFAALQASSLPVLDAAKGAAMIDAITAAQAQQDSLGGVIECAGLGLPVGLGGPLFAGLENSIASLIFAIPAVKGLEFGNGFAAAQLFGSENNDAYCHTAAGIQTTTNHHGGILGGLSTGMPLLFRVAVKPTPTISQPQQSVSLQSGEDTVLHSTGRHDPCIVPRAVPAVEAAAAIAIYDALLGAQIPRRGA